VTSPPASRRLVFREYVLHDVEALAPVFADGYAAQFYPQHSDPKRLVSWVEWSRRNYREHGFGLWALELRSDGTFAGDAGLTLQPVQGDSILEIGYHIHPALRAQGLASEAAAACLSWAFENTDHDVVCSIVHPDNLASIRVAERVHASRRSYESTSDQRLLFFTTREAWSSSTTAE
jgi:RimJ/RimL family protein N-acetyltransferase